MVNTLNDIRTSDKKITGTQGIGVLMANSLMFQRFPNHNGYDDPQFSSFYGQTLPLLKRGIPVELVHMENTPFKRNFQRTPHTCHVLFKHETDETGISQLFG